MSGSAVVAVLALRGAVAFVTVAHAELPIVAGKYTLHETWMISAAHAYKPLPCKSSSAEFAPDPALDPLWISYWEPFHGAIKKDFGFQITLKVVEDTAASTANGNGAEKLPRPEDGTK